MKSRHPLDLLRSLCKVLSSMTAKSWSPNLSEQGALCARMQYAQFQFAYSCTVDESY